MATIDEALALHQRGDLVRAEAVYREFLQAEPSNADAWHLLGVALHQAGRHLEAIEHIGRAISLSDRQAPYHGNLGLAHASLGHDGEAMACYCEALRLQPGYANAHNSMGALLHGLGRLVEAEASFREAIRLRPDYAEAHSNLGATLEARGLTAQAVPCHQEAVRLRPDSADFLNALGATLAGAGRPAEAIDCFERALRIAPNHADAHSNLGAVFHRQGKLAQAIRCCQEAARLRPNHIAALKNLATVFQEQGHCDQALDCLARARAAVRDDALDVRAALILPVIYPSMEEMDLHRRRVEAELAQLQARDLRIDNPAAAVGATAFEMAYQGHNDRDLQAALAQIYSKATPSLTSVAAHCQRRERPEGRPIRVGFLSRFFHNHTITRLNRGLVRHLRRPDFHVALLRLPGKDDALARAIQASADEVVVLTDHLEQARHQIAERRLDVLFYTDVGMDPLGYFLTFARLAPVQCATWGHPVTTGVPAIDYFVSSELLETEGAQAHYTEKLVRLKDLAVYYDRPVLPSKRTGRQELGLPTDAHLYGCPQSLFKLHPQFDELVGAILRRDPRGLLVLISGPHPSWDELLRERFRRTIPDVASRVRFVPRLGHEDFLALNAACDVLLDPIHFGGGNTAYEAFALGVPIVTWPSPFLRGRIALALYRNMGVLDCVAADHDHYVELAVRLATEPDFQAAVRSRIQAAAGALFEDAGGVRQLENFFKHAVAQRWNER